MKELDEKRLKRSMSLYDLEFKDSITFEDVSEGIPRAFSGHVDAAGLRSVPRICRSVVINDMTHFGYWILEKQDVRPAALDRAQRAWFLGISAERHLINASATHLAPGLEYMGELLLSLLATGRTPLIGPAEENARAILQSGRYAPTEGTTGYFTKPAKIGVFALEMLAAMRGETIDWESFHVPPDRFWLDCARIGLTEPDPAKAAEWATQLCEAHLQTLQTDKDNFSFDPSTGHEIDMEAHFLWPITVIAFLRLRAAQGLQTGEIDHPLMRTSFDILHGWSLPAGAWTPEPWFVDFLDKVEGAAPDISDSIKEIR